MPELALTRGDVADLDSLQQLWVAVHHQHQRSMPHLAPYVDDATTWRERRALYEHLFATRDPILLLAREDDEVIGYGLAYTMPASDTWLADTWRTGERIGEIESLAVLPDHRRRGLGSRIFERLHDELRQRGVTDVVLGVLPGNTDAVRFYERHGYRPTWLYLSRLDGRAGRHPEPGAG